LHYFDDPVRIIYPYYQSVLMRTMLTWQDNAILGRSALRALTLHRNGAQFLKVWLVNRQTSAARGIRCLQARKARR